MKKLGEQIMNKMKMVQGVALGSFLKPDWIATDAAAMGSECEKRSLKENPLKHVPVTFNGVSPESLSEGFWDTPPNP